MNTFMGAMLLGLVVAAGAIPAVSPPARRPSRGGSPHPARDPLDVDAYDLDGFDTPKATVDRIHANGGKGICYISVGSWESWRPDKGRFPKRILGRGYYGWPGEKWLDVRQLDALAPIMEARMDACKEKGFDAIEPDTTWTATRTGRASGSRTPSNSATTRSSQRPPARGASRSP